MIFKKESEFEDALIEILKTKGWESDVLMYPTEEELLQNWANILFDNNRDIDKLNNYPLTKSEMQQIIEQINDLKTPLKLNGFINGKSVSIKRDNPDDKEHFGKEVSLKIYDRFEIAAGQSRYQIARQPKFNARQDILPNRRGDVMLLINGMPVIHIELKRNDIPVSEACNQIKKYSNEYIFTGLFSLVQVFVAMTPNETLYFANPGTGGEFNKDFYFRWADFNNEPINDWDKIANSLLSIPMAHQLIGFYTVADNSDGILKVMRSYQYFAASKISDVVAKHNWEENNQLGGYIAHTTGSGKTMTSFKSAQLIAGSHDADKVVFLMDRIELGTQSLKEYRGFADDNEDVQETEDTYVLISKLKSDNPADTLIVTSIQKMNNIKDDGNVRSNDIENINKKRIVFIVDEAHRSTFGDMMASIKLVFPKALFFGFTGTPIQFENQKKMNTTASIFGDELHRYMIGDGIRDKNVLGFDKMKITTFKDIDLRRSIALEMSKAKTEDEAISDPEKRKVYYKFMQELPMAGYIDEKGKYVKGIEDYIKPQQYKTDEHQDAIVSNIKENWTLLSRVGKFHAIFATNSIAEAIIYYRKMKAMTPEIKVCALFDPSIDNNENCIIKEDALVEIITDYNKRYNQDFKISTYHLMKKDIAARLAHKKPYQRISNDKEQQIDILIVVDQMLTGFDSKWVNTIYIDKELKYEHLIQAFSRTNRIFGYEKPFGIIRYYRYPHTMDRNIEKAFELYSGNKAFAVFVQHLYERIKHINNLFSDIIMIFESAGVTNFEKLPDDDESCAMFVKKFNEFNLYLEAAIIQGFSWDKEDYFDNANNEKIHVDIDNKTYLVLVQRYKELQGGGGNPNPNPHIPYDIISHITEIDTGKIDDDYMNSKFQKYLKVLNDDSSKDSIEKVEEELHKTFAGLSQEEQKQANIILHDIQCGDLKVDSSKTLNDYINEYMIKDNDDRIHRICSVLGIYEDKLRKLMNRRPNENNLNDFGEYDELKKDIDKVKAKEYFERIEKIEIPPRMVFIKADKFLRNFILQGGFDIEL